MSRLRVHVLGGLAVFAGPRRLAIARSCHSVLGYLITHRHRRTSRVELAETLWAGHDGYHARRCLSTALWRLKKVAAFAAPLVIAQGSDEVSFNWPATAWVDSIALEFRVQRLLRLKADELKPEASSRLQRGVRLYKGDYLVGIDDEWALLERQRLRNLYLDASYHLILSYAAASDWNQVLEWGRRLSHEEPLREDVHRMLMRAYAFTGNRAKAVDQYQKCRRILQAELGVEPMPETQSLYCQILRSNELSIVTQPSAVPPPLAQVS